MYKKIICMKVLFIVNYVEDDKDYRLFNNRAQARINLGKVFFTNLSFSIINFLHNFVEFLSFFSLLFLLVYKTFSKFISRFPAPTIPSYNFWIFDENIFIISVCWSHRGWERVCKGTSSFHKKKKQYFVWSGTENH